jgi:hypothetical protein
MTTHLKLAVLDCSTPLLEQTRVQPNEMLLTCNDNVSITLLLYHPFTPERVVGQQLSVPHPTTNGWRQAIMTTVVYR